MFDKLKDLGGLMQQAQAMQQKVQELQSELERLEIVGSSGAGQVKVTVNGKNETRRVEIDASLFKPDDKGVVEDLIVATNATVDGQTTAHYLAERLADTKVPLTRLAHGVPVGGELDWLDDGTLATALKARRALT